METKRYRVREGQTLACCGTVLQPGEEVDLTHQQATDIAVAHSVEPIDAAPAAAAATTEEPAPAAAAPPAAAPSRARASREPKLSAPAAAAATTEE